MTIDEIIEAAPNGKEISQLRDEMLVEKEKRGIKGAKFREIRQSYGHQVALALYESGHPTVPM